MVIKTEQKILESDNGAFQLSTHRVRYQGFRWGAPQFVSIMLDHITSCEIVRRSNPLLLALAGLCFLTGLMLGEDSGVFTLGIVAAAVFVGIYFVTRKQYLVISSPSAHIRLDTSTVQRDAVLHVIDEIESAIVHRKSEL